MKQAGVEKAPERADTGIGNVESSHSTFAKKMQPVDQDGVEVQFTPESTRTGSQASELPAAGAPRQRSDHESHLAPEMDPGKEHEPQSNSDSEPDTRESIQKVRKLLNRRMRVVVTDGRVFEGSLSCLDKQGNLLLNNATEFSPRVETASSASLLGEDSKPRSDQRSLGLILIPKHARTSCQFQRFMEERMADLSLVS